MSTRWTQEQYDAMLAKRGQTKGNVNTGQPVEPKSQVPPPKPQTSKERYEALGRLKSREMNKTEQAYEARLEMLHRLGEILWYAFEPLKLRLADGCFYEIDFLVLTKERALEVHEVKGYWTDDALVKIKVAAETFPFRFVAVQLRKGEWVTREF
jgi:hypothetical protein